MGRVRKAARIKNHSIEHRIGRAAATAGLPEAQRGHALALAEAPQIGNEPSPVKETVRKLTRVERLARARVLEPHEAAACEWYADAHALGFDTVGVTANYEGGGGGGHGVEDVLAARYAAQKRARDDYRRGRGFLLDGHVAIFEAIVCRNDTVSEIAAASFDLLGRSQRENKVRLILKLCANRLHAGLAALMPIDAPAPPRLAAVRDEPLAPPAAAVQRPVSAAIDADLDRLEANGVDVARIDIAPFTLAMLELETGTREHYRGVPLAERESFGWGHVPIAAEQLDGDRQKT